MKAIVTKPQAARGRAFPMRLGDMHRLIRAQGLTNWRGAPLTIRHRNLTSESTRLTLAQLVPGREWQVFSVPSAFPGEVACAALVLAIPGLARLGGTTKPDTTVRRTSYAAVIEGTESLELVQRVSRLQARKYRASGKFSTGFKAHQVGVEEVTLETHTL